MCLVAQSWESALIILFALHRHWQPFDLLLKQIHCPIVGKDWQFYLSEASPSSWADTKRICNEISMMSHRCLV